eukprot:g306.t1
MLAASDRERAAAAATMRGGITTVASTPFDASDYAAETQSPLRATTGVYSPERRPRARAPGNLRSYRPPKTTEKAKKSADKAAVAADERDNDGVMVRIEAAVEDASTGLPIPNALVQLSNSARGAPLLAMRTTATGEVVGVMKLPEPMKLHFSASHAKYNSDRKSARVGASKNQRKKVDDSNDDTDSAQPTHVKRIVLKLKPLEICARLRVEVVEASASHGNQHEDNNASTECEQEPGGNSASKGSMSVHGRQYCDPLALQGVELSVVVESSAEPIPGVGDDAVLCTAHSTTQGTCLWDLVLLHAAKCKVIARKSGFREASSIIALSHSEHGGETVVRLEMSRAHISQPVIVRVRDGVSQRPLYGANVELTRDTGGKVVACGITNRDGELRTELQATGTASCDILATVTCDGWLEGRRKLTLAAASRGATLVFDVTLTPPPEIELKIEAIGVDGDRRSAMAGANIVVLDSETGAVAARAITSALRGTATIRLQAAQAERCIVEVSQAGWATAQTAALDPTARDKLAIAANAAKTGRQSATLCAVVNASAIIELSRTSHQRMGSELLVAVGDVKSTVGMINIEPGHTTLRDVRSRLRAERLRGMMPLCFHFVLKGAAVGTETELHHLAEEAAPVLVLQPVQIVRPTIKLLTTRELVIKWEPPPALLEQMLKARRLARKSIRQASRQRGTKSSLNNEPAVADAGEFVPFDQSSGSDEEEAEESAGENDDDREIDGVGFAIEVRSGKDIDERKCSMRTLCNADNDNKKDDKANHECELLLDSFAGRPFHQGGQYDIIIRSAMPDRQREDVVPLSVRMPMFTDEPELTNGVLGLPGASHAQGKRGKFDAFHSSILFHPSSTQWKEDSGADEALRKIGALLKKHPDVRLQVRGHCNGGLDNLNIEEELSWGRAANVCEFLVSCGAKPAQLELEGKACAQQLVPPNSKAAWKNRRVDFFPIW